MSAAYREGDLVLVRCEFDLSELGFVFGDIVLQRKHQSFCRFGSHDYPAYHFRLRVPREVRDEIHYEFCR